MINTRFFSIFIFLIAFLIFTSCNPEESGNEKMRFMLTSLNERGKVTDNFFANEIRFHYFDSLRTMDPENIEYWQQAGREAIRAGKNNEAIQIFSNLLSGLADSLNADDPLLSHFKDYLALAYLRKGEVDNCLHNHSPASCIIPLAPAGFHQIKTGSQNAVAIYAELLQAHPDNLKYRWLYNIAQMTLGAYPAEVKPYWLIAPANFSIEPQSIFLPQFQDIASHLNLAVNQLSGGVILEDFNNDGLLDIMVSSWHLEHPLHIYWAKAENGWLTYEENSKGAGLAGITGGLNLVQGDYNNDGWTDVLVLRGAWLMQNGRHPNSLLCNNGDGTFSDVTEEAGLLSFHPTQTAVWRDFNNDGWLDIYIGNEATSPMDNNACELFINQQDGTFINFARQAKVEINRFVKGVAAADIDNDGRQDLYVSTLKDKNYLLRNTGNHKEGYPVFEDITASAGLKEALESFPCWFWDYNNDGWQDIYVNEFLFEVSGESDIISKVAAGYIGLSHHGATPHLFRNNGNGTFTEVTDSTGLNKVAYTMGCNFGDFNNDGWLDCYLATGEPALGGVMPNRAFLNQDGKIFRERTTALGLGHIQKGHAVAFADLDGDGDQDIYHVLGGAFTGDNYPNALFENNLISEATPEESLHNWLRIKLEGLRSNRDGIGARVKIVVKSRGEQRKIYREVNSGGSFGSSPLRLEVGLGDVEDVNSLQVYWPASELTQHFENVPLNSFIKIREGQTGFTVVSSPLYRFKKESTKHDHLM